MLENGQNVPWWEPALKLFGEVAGLIAAPIVIALYVGRWLDERFDTDPIFFIGITALAMIFSTIAIVHISTRYMKEMEKNDKKNNGNTTSNK
ncbi:MAG: AtpZ/AtpI family protein [Parcubacteria group bacterium]